MKRFKNHKGRDGWTGGVGVGPPLSKKLFPVGQVGKKNCQSGGRDFFFFFIISICLN